jgi:hypothetical protein
VNNPARRPIIPHLRYETDPTVEIALEAAIQEVCASGEIDSIWKVWPCDQGKALAAHKLMLHVLGQKFVDQGEVNLSVYADNDYCGFTLQVNPSPTRPETAVFRGIPMSARRNLAREGAL